MAKYLYGYHEERGFADLYVTDKNGNTVWEVHYPSFYESNGDMLEETTIFEDGFMESADDIEGLESYLKSISVINKGDMLVDIDDDEDDDDDDDEYAAGGTIESKIKKRLKNAFELPIQVAVYVPSTRDKDIIIPKREMEARVEEVQRFLANAFGGFSAVKVEGGFESSDKGLIQEDAVRVVAFASKENENGVPFEKSFESLMNQVKNWCSKWSQQSIGVEFENDLFYVDTETKFAGGGFTQYGEPMGFEEESDSVYEIHHKPNYNSKNPYLIWDKIDGVYIAEFPNRQRALHFIDYKSLNYYEDGGYMAKGGEVEDEVYNAYVVWIDDNDEAFFDGGWWSIEDAEDRVSDIEWEEDNKPKYKVFAVEYDEDYFENKNWDITRMKSYKPYPLTRMAKGGEVDLSPYKDIHKLNMLYKSGSKWYAWGKKYNIETKGEGYTKKEALQDLDNHLSYVSEDDEFADGGEIAEGNLQMLRSNAKAIKHHAEELEGELNDDTEVEAWVVAKGERAATDLSDITHYLDGKEFSLGGMTAGRWYRDNSGEEFKFIGKIDSGVNKGRFLFSDGKQSVYKDLEDFEGGRPKETKLFGFFEDGGMMADGGELSGNLYKVGFMKVYEDAEVGDNVYVKEFYAYSEKEALSKFKKLYPNYKVEFVSKYEDGGMMAKGGSIKSLEKRVAEVNELIKRGNELGIEVVDEGNTWQAPMKYKPLKYTNGVLYVSYEQLDLYKYSKEYVKNWEKKSYKIGKYESGYGYKGEAGAAQREALTEIARMYRKPLKSYDTYGYFEDGGEVNKVNPEEIKVKIEQILDKVVPSFYKGVSIRKNIFDTGNNIRIFIAASDYKINGVSGQLPQVVSLSLDLSDMDLHPQVFGGNGGQRIDRKPNMNDPKEKYLAMKGVKVPFRTPQPNEKAVLDAIKRFAENYKKTLAENKEVLLYQDIVDYDKLLADSQYADGGMMAKGGEVIDKLWQGYAEAILFTEIDLDTDEPLDSNYSISDFDSKTVKDSKEMLRKFYNDNKDAIIKSGLDLSIVGNDVWYTRSGQGAGFFDHSLEDDTEKKLIAGAKALGEYPSVETYDGKISVRGGRVFKKGGTFAAGVKAIEKRLVGTKVNPKYQKDYGKTYDKEEAHEAASKIKGKMRAMELANKYKKKKLAKGGTIQDQYDKLRKIEHDARNSYYRARDTNKWYDSVGNNYMKKWDKQVAKLKKLDGFEPNYDFGDAIS